MPLPSQIARPKARHSHMYRRRRGRRRPFLIALVVLLALVVGVWWMRGDAQPKATLADAAGAGAGEEPGAGAGAEAAPPVYSDRSPMQPQEQGPRVRLGESRQSSSLTPNVPASTDPAPAERRVEAPAGPAPSPTSPAPAPARRDPVEPRSRPAPSPAAPAAPTAAAAPPSSPDRDRALQQQRSGMELMAANRPLEARRALSQALASGALTPPEGRRVREILSDINERLIFSPEVVAGDPFASAYVVRPNDSLLRITSREQLNVDWRLIQRINRILRPEAIRPGQTLKLIHGPFHAIVDKRDFRMDVYIGEGPERVFVRSFAVGLGEYDSTPIGLFRVRANSKLINPEWVNPRTGQRFRADDPANPIGERWIGLEGVSESVRDLGGYGIHGTIEPETIGHQASMGCIRMLPDDVELVYELLVESMSTVQIVDGLR